MRPTYTSASTAPVRFGQGGRLLLNLKPGTDGALALCWQHIIIEHDLVDWEFVKRWTDASLLVVEDMEPTDAATSICHRLSKCRLGGSHRHEAEDPSSEGE